MVDGIPEHKVSERICEGYKKVGDKESPKACTHLKSCDSLYTCPRAPFYRKMKGLLHSNITLESKIPSVNTYTNVFYIP
jgi:hypothetical protein